MVLTICKEIRHVKNGYIIELRWPHGGEPLGYGEIICKTLDEVFEHIFAADVDPLRLPDAHVSGGKYFDGSMK